MNPTRHEIARPVRVLLVGTLPPPIGGISVSFQLLVNLLKARDDIQIDVINLSDLRGRKHRAARGMWLLCRAIAAGARRADVISVYCASTALPSLGLLALVLARLFRRPLIVRKAAGLDYMDLGPVKGRIAHFVIKRSDLYLAQTKRLVTLAKERGISRVEWYPTSRIVPDDAHRPPPDRRSCRRFVYIGQVREYKGIAELALAAERLPAEAVVHIYGPWFDDLDSKLFVGRPNVAYLGLIEPSRVAQVMRVYDAFVLPSKSPTEGYPGSILEAYCAGLPVIAAASGAIPEIVDTEVGLLVPPGDVDMLVMAMRRLMEHDAMYHQLRRNAFERAKQFSSAMWAERFVQHCRDLAAQPAGRHSTARGAL